MGKKKRKVLVATPAYGGQLTDHYVQSMLETQKVMMMEQIEMSVLILSNESLINRGRNKCAQMALTAVNPQTGKPEPFTDLFFIDADIGWSPQDFLKILKSPQHVIGGTYPMKMLPVNLNYNLLYEDRLIYQTSHIKSVDIMKQLIHDKGKEEIQVQHVPTGFMRISDTALKRLKPKVEHYHQQNPRTGEMEDFWEFFPVGVKDKNLMSEDWYFCELCKENKIPVFMNCSVILNHVGTYNYGESIQR